MTVMRAVEGGILLAVHVQPGASRSEVAGLHGDALKVRVASPPVDGRANAALVNFVAELLAVPRAGVRIISGQTGRRKLLRIEGLTLADAERRLELGGS
jgi:uncharacterized protein (TIGR00251 family)